LRILTESSGSLTTGYLIQAIQDAGFQAVASDITSDCVGQFLADDFMLVPKADHSELWPILARLLEQHSIDMVLPSLDETLLGWAERRERFREDLGCHVIISSPETLVTFQDKWLTHQFFVEHGMPCPATSLEQDYPLVKPRFGRGGIGVEVTERSVNMEGMVSQELLTGTEYTIDILCDSQGEPIYIVPRKRLGVREGKSTGGIVEMHAGIIEWVRKLCLVAPFVGPVNAQCFVSAAGDVQFVEVNTRIAGGMALGFAASENWIPLLASHFIDGKAIKPVSIHDGLRMMRYYAEVFVP
jgi:carbamoyl-phosphate synthase large subunit